MRKVDVEDRKTLLLIADHIGFPSGVGKVARTIIERTCHLFNWVMIGGNIGREVPLRAEDVTSKFAGAEKVVIYPHKMFGNKDIVRYLMNEHDLDGIMIFNDPFNFYWLFEMEDEIRREMPLMYYHVWDNLPVPEFNEPAYNSCDWIGCASKLTYHCVHELHQRSHEYIPHGIDSHIFYPIRPEMTKTQNWKGEEVTEHELVQNIRREYFGSDDQFIVFWNNRNLHRKRAVDVIRSFVSFVDELPVPNRKEVSLLLKTQPNDPAGPDLYQAVKAFGKGYDIKIIDKYVSDAELNWYYNAADVTVNIAAREGFGLTTAESLMAGTPIVVNVTGGLQDQCGFSDRRGDYITARDYEGDWGSNSDGRFIDSGAWAIPFFPVTTTTTGSQSEPYCFEDIVGVRDIGDAIKTWYIKTREERKAAGMKGRTYLMRKDVGMTADEMARRIAAGIESTIETFEPKSNYELVLC